MDDAFDQRCTVLAEAWQWWATTLLELDGSSWRRRTRLEGWDVAALVAHHSLLVQGLEFLASQPVDAAPQTATAVEMLQRFNGPDGIARTGSDAVAEIARQHSENLSPQDLTTIFHERAPHTILALRTAGEINVDYFGNGIFPIGEAVTISILEAVVHGLDLAHAVELDGQTIPAAAFGTTMNVLVGMADPVELVEAATGRRPITVFPVLR